MPTSVDGNSIIARLLSRVLNCEGHLTYRRNVDESNMSQAALYNKTENGIMTQVPDWFVNAIKQR